MKKLISMLQALVMVFGLAACGSSNANEAAQTTAEVTTAPAEDAAEELTDVTALGEGVTSFIFTLLCFINTYINLSDINPNILL